MKKLFVFVAVLAMVLGMGANLKADLIDPDAVTYVYGNAGSPPYEGRPDNTGDDLANGYVFLGSWDFSDPDWVTFYGTPCIGADIRFDLGAVYNLNSIEIYYLTGWGSQKPVSVDFSFSVDGINFTDPVNMSPFTDPEYSFPITTSTVFPVAGTARYVNVFVYPPAATAPYYDDNWFTLGEVVFDGTIPEPATMSLLAVGLLGLIRRK